MAKYTQRLLPKELRYLARDCKTKHYNDFFYCNPVQVPGYRFPPKMLTIVRFGLVYGYSEGRIFSFLKSKQLLAVSWKKWTFVCPNPQCFFDQNIILDFWERT